MRAHRGVGRPWPSPSPGHAGQPHGWDVGLGKELESPRQAAVFLCGLPSTRWAPCGLNTGPGSETQPRKRAGEGSTGWAECCCPGQEVGQRRAQWLSAAWAPVRRGCLSRALLHMPPPMLGTLSPNPRPTYLLDPSCSPSHVASPLPLEVGPASTPIPQTGSPLGVW